MLVIVDPVIAGVLVVMNVVIVSMFVLVRVRVLVRMAVHVGMRMGMGDAVAVGVLVGMGMSVLVFVAVRVLVRPFHGRGLAGSDSNPSRSQGETGVLSWHAIQAAGCQVRSTVTGMLFWMGSECSPRP